MKAFRYFSGLAALLLLSAQPAIAGPQPQSAIATARLLSSAATTNATLVRAIPGTITRVVGYNASTSARWLKFYDKSSAPTVGTDTPRKTIYLPPTTAFALDMDDYYGQGIGLAITANGADNDTAAVLSGDILGLAVDYR